MTHYACFAELARHESVEADYRVILVERKDSKVAILAPHGGEIEVGTSEMATLIAGDEHSLFCFEGLRPAHGRHRLHITSHRFDHPDCLDLAARRPVVLSVHGCRGHDRIFIGGLDVELGLLLTERLSSAGFTAVCDGHPYPGRHPLNICNRGSRGKGAQLEITYDLRGPEHRTAIARAVRKAVVDFEPDGLRA